MKLFTLGLSALLAGFISAQTFSALPECAQNCTINAIPKSCNLNPKCICSDAGFIKAITCCVAGVCDAADQETTIKYADSICIPAGVTNLPTAASCASTANSTASKTGTAAGGASSATGSTTASTNPAASSLGSSVSSIASSAVSQTGSSATSGAAVSTSTGDANRAFLAQGLGVVGAAIGAVALM